MKGTGAVVVIVLLVVVSAPLPAHLRLVTTSSVLSQDSGGPFIGWYDLPENGTLGFMWDGAYTGQTEEVWVHRHWVNDSDGVDCVIFRYMWTSQNEWMNRTATRIQGNDTNGYYRANFTYAVWWNHTSEYPQTEGSGGNFAYKVWANDTLGHWSEVEPVSYMGGYIYVEPPSASPTTTSGDIWAALQSALQIVAVPAVVLIAVLVLYLVRPRFGHESET
jgi:hypothetical protein